MRFRDLIKLITPPILITMVKGVFNRWPNKAVEWQYIPEGWGIAQTDHAIKGWNVKAVLEAYQKKWPDFIKSLEGPQPLGFSPETTKPHDVSLTVHNLIMSYAYALTLASRKKSSISLLDWGGGIGHYYLISRALFPNLEIDYHCKDVPILADYGQSIFPNAHFYSEDASINRSFDFVLASSSLHYSEDWKSVLRTLAHTTGGYLFVTRLPVVHKAGSFVFVQRPYAFGYNTEYLGWCLNRNEFLNAAEQNHLFLEREFITGEAPIIYKAPEPCEYRGFLFSRMTVD